eukprot:CAMPEP_0172543664 /NCGR_PEP_ID=MMETSP1067-20121228/13992_1 /TAXON_ID=265564 ORGANISM="Thalassiosira punctigera, Strain Tpunct2005C2" /NCGR_SAMPLE_ID=MMETSP1067 /ASSEMBLY_ACC=CAM_ASM_000444 /LENGTH=329 /DNA_ID=CAMNT_0013330115 /DNA_START=57 /DNA_END=1046 /DNA_ORIENTATION=-
MSYRCCATCGRNFPKHSYSNNQWRKGVGASRCHACVESGSGGVYNYNGGGGGHQGSSNRAAQTARRNDATRATFTNHALTHPFAEGGFRWVAKGTYTEGARAGEACVCKWFKSGHVVEVSFFAEDIKAMDKAHELVREWNSRRMIDKIIKVNIPEVWTFNNLPFRQDFSCKKVLQEPFISNYQKFNSNTGWADNDTPWPRVMQALSHFSYHVSSGQFVLCDLQGGVYSNAVVLTDPVILSRSKMYGVTDLGPQGISSFFSNHVCNEFCSAGWSRPADQRCYFRPQAGTSMVRAGGGTNANQYAPTHQNRIQVGYSGLGVGYVDESDEDY